jgi:hypothetical protein
MNTTLDLPEDLLKEAQAAAERRQTSLPALVEEALRRELARSSDPVETPDQGSLELGANGIRGLKNQGNALSVQKVRELIDHQYDEEDARVLEILRKS